MTTTKINRRTALLGTAAALAPAAAMGKTSEPPTFSAEPTPVFETYPDPFVSAFCRYEAAEQACIRHARSTASLPIEEHEKQMGALCDASSDAMLEMGKTVPTTTLGLYLAICALLPVFGEPKVGGGDNLFSFEDMEVKDQWTNGSGDALLRSLRTAAERILNGNEEAV